MNRFIAIILFSFLLLSQISSLHLLTLYTIAIIVLGIYTFLNDKMKIDKNVLIFAIISLIGILAKDIPTFFKPYQRYSYWILLLIGCSSLIYNKRLVYYRRCLLLNVCSISVIITLLSFISYIVGFGYQAGNVGFWGVALHGNILGAMAMISLIYSVYHFINDISQKKYIFLLFCGISIIILLLASSRNALVCSIVGFLCFLKLHFRKKSSVFITTIFTIIILLIIIYPYLGKYTSGLETKMSYGYENNSITASRTTLWNTRIEEFRRNPILGVGTFAVDTTIKNSDKFFNPYNRTTGVVELGSTYLGILSQNGLLGFISFISIILISIKQGYQKTIHSYDRYDILFFSILISFILHMNFEGYSNTAGQILTLILWLVIGCNSYKPINCKYKSIKGIIYY